MARLSLEDPETSLQGEYCSGRDLWRFRGPSARLASKMKGADRGAPAPGAGWGWPTPAEKARPIAGLAADRRRQHPPEARRELTQTRERWDRRSALKEPRPVGGKIGKSDPARRPANGCGRMGGSTAKRGTELSTRAAWPRGRVGCDGRRGTHPACEESGAGRCREAKRDLRCSDFAAAPRTAVDVYDGGAARVGGQDLRESWWLSRVRTWPRRPSGMRQEGSPRPARRLR